MATIYRYENLFLKRTNMMSDMGGISWQSATGAGDWQGVFRQLNTNSNRRYRHRHTIISITIVVAIIAIAHRSVWCNGLGLHRWSTDNLHLPSLLGWVSSLGLHQWSTGRLHQLWPLAINIIYRQPQSPISTSPVPQASPRSSSSARPKA